MIDETIGNQQAKDTDLAWLAGIIDGEGSILLGSKGHFGEYKGFHGINIGASIYITNTCGNIINKCDDVLKSLGINCRIAEKNPTSRGHAVLRVELGKMSLIKILLESIMPYLVSKIGQAKLVHKFVSQRMLKGKKQYDEEDIAVITLFYDNYHGIRGPNLPKHYNVIPSKASTT